MASYYDRDDESYGDRRAYGRGRRGERQGEMRSGDSGWVPGREDPGRFESGMADNYDRGYASQPYTGDEQGSGYAGGRDFGGSYTSESGRGWGNSGQSEGGYRRGFGASRRDGPQYGPQSNRHYEGTYRPPDYGHDFDERSHRTHRGEGVAGDRGWLNRASDEVSSWFGDEDAERRRRMDKSQMGEHRGRGPKGYRRSDERIKEDINDRLTDHAYLDATDVVVVVKEAEVTLDGTVNHRAEKRLAEDVAESVSGVRHVQNNLRVKDEQISGAGLETQTRSASH